MNSDPQRFPVLAWIRSLRSKMLLSHLAVIFIAAIITGFSLLSLAESYFLNALENSLVSQAHVITQSLLPQLHIDVADAQNEPAFNAIQQQVIGNLNVQIISPSDLLENESASSLSQAELNSLRDFTIELSSTIETRFLLIDLEGSTVISSADLDLEPYKEIPATRDAFGGQITSSVEMIKGEDWLFVATPLLQQDDTVAVLLLGHPLRDITAVLTDLRSRLILAVGIAIPLASLLAFSLSRNFLRPVNVLAEAARGMQVGVFDVPLSVERRDELGQLSRTFDSMRSRLLEVEKLRTQFISDVSHELRTPLTAIKGLTESLQDGAVDDPAVRDRFLDSIERETDRLIRMTNDLLTLTRVDAGGMKLKLENFDLRKILVDTKTKLSPEAKRRRVQIQMELPEEPILVTADQDRIDQVLTNIMDNALKHSPADAGIFVSLRDAGHIKQGTSVSGKINTASPNNEASKPALPPGPRVMVCVQDRGTGVPAKDLPHIFERFYRADYSRSRDHGGSGLGLAIARAIMDAHGGHIQLLSPSPDWDGTGNPGTTVVLTLPTGNTPL
ncbi:MAG: HAMP domain-containing protein [Anaerolineales bacterium]|nr:HAMP domain-containing protein [Anaerolineales bacterium]